MEKTKPVLNLVVEAEGDTLWGRIHYNDVLIVDEAENVEELEKKMRSLVSKEYKFKTPDYDLEILYDISALFKQHKTLNASIIAERAGINRSLMAQYAAGIKYPSLRRTAEIQQVIHSIGNELRSINLAVKMEPVASFDTFDDLVSDMVQNLNFEATRMDLPDKQGRLKFYIPWLEAQYPWMKPDTVKKIFEELRSHQKTIVVRDKKIEK